MKIKLLITFTLLLIGKLALGQYKWWNDLHNWDGCTHWYYYLKFAPKYLGPNALPVPRVSGGNLRETVTLENTAVFHFSDGANTQNLKERLYWPIAEGKAAIEASGVPIEHYHMDSATRDDRVARDYDGKGYASGDLHVNTYVQIVEDHEKWPDILLRVHLRAPSGNNVEAARYTDAPGYSFDLSTRREWQLSPKTRLNWKLMGGFYFWQNNQRNKQIDAYLYGTGLALKHNHTTIQTNLAGYSGYSNDGDRPLLIRAGVKHRIRKKFGLKLALQHGLHDFIYTTAKFSALIYFPNQEDDQKNAE